MLIWTGLLLGGCWLESEPERPQTPSSLDSSAFVNLDCSDSCTSPVCGSNGYMFCNACDAANAGYAVLPASFCTAASVPDTQTVIDTAQLIAFWEYYERIKEMQSDSLAYSPTLVFPTAGCSCFGTYDPVCSSFSGLTYMNSCIAGCAQDSSTLSKGTCLELYSLPDGSSLDAFAPLIEPMLAKMTGPEFLQLQQVLNNITLPASLQSLPADQASELALQLAVGQMMLDSTGAALITKYLGK